MNIGGTLGLRGYPEFGYIVGTRAYMLNQEIRFPVLTHLTLGTPLGDIDFPEIQAGFFGDVGKARSAPGLGAGVTGELGHQLPLGARSLRGVAARPGSPLQRWQLPGYSLDRSQRDPGFVHFFFGYNY